MKLNTPIVTETELTEALIRASTEIVRLETENARLTAQLDGFEIAGYRVTGIYEGREGTDVVDSLHRAEEIAEVMTDCCIEPLYVRLASGDKS